MNLRNEVTALITAFNRAEIPYAICGGLAVAVHGLIPLDLMIVVPELESVWESSQTIDLWGQRVSVVSRQGLQTLKRLAGRRRISRTFWNLRNGNAMMSDTLPRRNIDHGLVDMSKEAIERRLDMAFQLSDLCADLKQAGRALKPPTTLQSTTSPPEPK